MMDRSVGPIWIGAGIILALVVALASAGLLKVLATPANYQARLNGVEQKVLRAERLAGLPGEASTYPKGAVCDGLAERPLGLARQAFEEAATAEGLSAIQVALGAPSPATAKIAPVALSLRAQGPYEKVAGFMDRLSRGAPAVFIDTADITPSAGGVQLNMTGKVFCWTRG